MEININIPQSWNELTDKQLGGIAELLYVQGDLFNFSVFFILNDVRWWQFYKAFKIKMILKNVGISELVTHFSFIYKEQNRTVFPNLKGYDKPMDRFINLTIEEYAVADDLNNLYLRTKDRKYLVALCAVLYKKPGERYDHLKLNHHSKRFKRMPARFLLSVHIAFNGCKNNLVGRYQKVYPKVAVAPKVSAGGKSAGFLDVVLKKSGQKFGTYEETKRTNLFTFMSDFEESLIQQEKWKEKYPTKK